MRAHWDRVSRAPVRVCGGGWLCGAVLVLGVGSGCKLIKSVLILGVGSGCKLIGIG